MSYLTQADLATLIPPEFIVEALDDDGDGGADPGLWDAVATEVSEAVDGYLAQRYSLPLPLPLPPLVSQAAKIFACELLHQRRGLFGDKNPFHRRADDLREKLQAISSGESPLSAAATPAAPSISIISEPAGTVPRSRLNA